MAADVARAGRIAVRLTIAFQTVPSPLRHRNTHGVDLEQGLVVNEVWVEGGVKDAGARLWPQTERLKAALAMARLWPSEGATFEETACHAWRGIQMFIHPKEPGLFRDKRAADGTFGDEAALASSLYHMVGAVSALLFYTGVNTRP